jgi:outer membrane lipoprotein SlyB
MNVMNTPKGAGAMKRSLIIFMIMTLFATGFVFTSSITVEAQSYYTKRVVRNGRVQYVRVRKPSYYRRHRNRINMGIGTAGGAILGGLLGGRKGALAGAAVGAGGSALYTYKLNPKRRKYRKVRRY